MLNQTYLTNSVVKKLSEGAELGWVNPKRLLWEEAKGELEVSVKDIDEAEERLNRFAPFIRKCFPETEERQGIIESPLTPIPEMQRFLNDAYGEGIEGNLLLKQDSHLAVAGSVKARGGIYEVLKHTEELALREGLLTVDDDYAKLASEECREFFSQYTMQVGSTGNLGLSIGIASAAVGYRAIVHMSADAKQWKKDLLRSHGVTVIEYDWSGII